MTDTLQFATDLARVTGEILRSYFDRPGTRASYKPDHTLLTEADLASNRHVSAAIRAAYPNDHILSEEEDRTFASDGRATWIIDPLDGTTNFSQGLHYWGVSIARIVEGRPQVAALSFPMLNERYSAEAGRGAWLNEEPLTVPPGNSHMVSFFLCDSRVHRRYSTTIRYKPRILGSAAYNFCAVAKGIGVVGFESIPKIWDIAASWLVLKEAGGALLAVNGEFLPLENGRDYNGLSIPVLGAADAGLLEAAREKIQFNQ